MNPATAITSLNQIPALHRFVASLGLSVFDFGAGKKGKIDIFYQHQKTPRVYLPYDPFNRDPQENTNSWEYLEDNGVDVVTCSNVLNVLDDAALAKAVNLLRYATAETTKGICFVSVYHAPSKPRNLQRKGYVQRNQPISEYIPFLQKEFDKVWNLGKFLVCSIH